jgi:hypothetical protein
MSFHELDEALDIPAQEMAFIRKLNNYQVRYLVVGGYAVRFHGHLRLAKDLDILVDNSEDNLKRLCEAITDLIGPQPDITVDKLRRSKYQIRLYQSHYDIDVLTLVEGLDFETAYSERATVTVSSNPIQVISKKHLVFSKKVSNRELDLEDIQALQNC